MLKTTLHLEYILYCRNVALELLFNKINLTHFSYVHTDSPVRFTCISLPFFPCSWSYLKFKI